MSVVSEAISIFQRGGPVMWPLLGLSVVSVALSLERALYWLRLHAPGRRERNERFIALLRRRDLRRVESAAAGDRSLYAAAARELAEEPLAHGAGGTQAIELVERYRPGFERFSAVMTTIITASPLLGILGTVLGIIDAFDLLGAGRVDDVTAVAAGIAQALITTAFGLIIALVTLFPAMLFRAQADRCLGTLERFAAAASIGAATQTAAMAPMTRGGDQHLVDSDEQPARADQAVDDAASSLPSNS
jgi:biopolymer transport protein ExbB